jgi:hypothetical protein
VNPGIVFQLVHEHFAVFADEHVDARHPLALGGDERAQSELARAGDLRRRDLRRHT